MKIIFGTTELMFNTTKSKIVDETLEIIENYKTDMSGLNQWLTSEQNRIKNEYERRQASIVIRTEDALRKHATGVAK